MNELIDRSLLLTVFISSLLGSWHCAGMCGPLALFAGRSNKYLYHLGRGMAYILLGSLVGSLGEKVLFLESTWFRTIGLSLLVLVLIFSFLGHMGFLTQKINPLQMKLFKALHLEKKSGFVIGLMSGLIPCGWLWMNLSTAGASLDPINGALIMGLFWLGTIPALWGVTQVMSRNVLSSKESSKKYVLIGLFMMSLFSIGGQFWLLQKGIHCKVPSTQLTP